MELTVTYILSQIVTIFVYVFLSLTYCVKNRKVILAFSFTSNFLNAIAFILLGAYTSAIMCAISILRDIIFLIDEKINGKSKKITKKDIIILAFIYTLSIISIIITFKGFLTLLYAIASLIYTFSVWQKNNKIYRLLGIPVILISLCDSIYIKSIFGVILQTVVMITSIIGFITSVMKERTQSLNNGESENRENKMEEILN